MSTDLHDLLARGATPVHSTPDVATIWRSGRRRRALRRTAFVAVPLALIALAVPFAVRTEHSSPPVRILPAASPSEIQAGWQRQVDAIGPDTFVNDVASGAHGFVAVGYGYTPNAAATDPTRVAIWTSPDGSEWVRVSNATLPTNATALHSVVFWNDRYWAVGTGPRGFEYWSSPDGLRWHEESNGITTLPVGGLVADSVGLIAFGDGVAVTSDGLGWQRGELPGFVRSIVRHDDLLVALTRQPIASGVGRGEVFVSRDGVHWTGSADLGPDVDPGGAGLTVWRGELWATTYSGGQERASTVWRSTDGSNWTPDVTSAPPDASFDTLTPLGPYLVASGFDTGSRPGAWVSADGSTWIPRPDLDAPPGGRLNLSATDGRILVALSTSELRDTYRWVAPSK